MAIPYAKVLARNTARKTVRMRRDFSQVLRAIQAHALLHRERRERDDKGQIVATLADYAVVRALMGDRLAEASEVRLRKNVALTVQAVQQLQQQREHHDGVSTRAIVNKLNKDRTTVWRRLDLARHRGFVVNVAEGGREGLWRATGQPTEGTVLPTVDELKQALAAPAEEERQTPQNRTQQRNR